MDRITLEELKRLSTRSAEACVSIFMPAHRRGREINQDPIRLRNLLRSAEERLQGNGWRSADTQKLLQRVEPLLHDTNFWQHQSDGLALFLTPDDAKIYRMPLAFEERVVVAKRFHLKPLLPFLTNNGRFYVLALSQNQVRLLEGTRHTVDEVRIEHMPATMAEALQYERFERQLQFHTGTQGGVGNRTTIFHGVNPNDEAKNQILRWFQRINQELAAFLKGDRAPLVLAGVEYLLPIYKEANSYPHLLDNGLRGNPELLKPEELQALAWPLVEPHFTADQEKAAARYAQLAGTGQATSDVETALLAAVHGRVECAFVPVGVQIWGTLDREAHCVKLHKNAENGDEDLLNRIAIETLLSGGSVFAVEPAAVPERAPIAAILRY